MTTPLAERLFALAQRGTSLRTEVVAGATTFATMAYIVVVQPAVLSGQMFGSETGIDFGAALTATCLSAAFATAFMALYARTPIAQAPGMGENFFVVLGVIPAAAAAGHPEPWRAALGVVFVAGVLFLAITLLGARAAFARAVSPSLRAAIAAGIGLFVAFIGLQNAGVIVASPATLVQLGRDASVPGLVVFAVGLFAAAALQARGVTGAVLVAVAAAAATAAGLRALLGDEVLAGFAWPEGIVSAPPSLGPTWLRMDVGAALAPALLPSVLVLLLMDYFDTMGTLVGVTEAAGLEEKGAFPHPERAYLSDAVGTVAGAALGTSTVTSFIESAAGVEQGGRTGLSGLVTAALFLVSLFFLPVVAMIGSYPPITAPALVLVGAMMMRSARDIAWDDVTEALPALLVLLGIPLSYSISDGLALGLVSWPILKLLSGRWKELGAISVTTGLVLLGYLLFLR